MSSTPAWSNTQANPPPTAPNNNFPYDNSSFEPFDPYAPNETNVNADHQNSHKRNAIVGGAAIAGTAAGLAIAGPLIGIVGGVAAATVATRETKAGDIARASGDAVLTVGDRAKDLDQKHGILDKTKKGMGSVVDKAKEMDEKHNIVDKTKRGVGNTYQNVRKFEEKHAIMERAGEGLMKGFNFVSNKLKPNQQQTQYKPKQNSNYSPWPDRD
jgi:hypothetical protein